MGLILDRRKEDLVKNMEIDEVAAWMVHKRTSERGRSQLKTRLNVFIR